MPEAPTARLGLVAPSGGDPISMGDDIIRGIAAVLDPLVFVWKEGTHAARLAATPTDGWVWWETDTSSLWLRANGAWTQIYPDTNWQTGDLKAGAYSTVPTGWLLCDGSAVSRAGQAALFAKLGTTYGAGDGSTTFNVPDLRGRVPVGVDGTAGRLSANDALGNSGGEEKHLLTSGESGLRDHNHQELQNSAGVQLGGTGINFEGTVTGGSPSGLASDYIHSSGAQNAQTAHNNMQPYQVFSWFIKT